jgi:hypothetical protein
VTEHLGQAALSTCGLSFLAGCTITQVNEYLQAGAFIVSMVAGLCAAVYYVKKATEKP